MDFLPDFPMDAIARYLFFDEDTGEHEYRDFVFTRLILPDGNSAKCIPIFKFEETWVAFMEALQFRDSSTYHRVGIVTHDELISILEGAQAMGTTHLVIDPPPPDSSDKCSDVFLIDDVLRMLRG